MRGKGRHRTRAVLPWPNWARELEDREMTRVKRICLIVMLTALPGIAVVSVPAAAAASGSECRDSAVFLSSASIDGRGIEVALPDADLSSAIRDWRNGGSRDTGRIFRFSVAGSLVEQRRAPVGWNPLGATLETVKAFGLPEPEGGNTRSLAWAQSVISDHATDPGGFCTTATSSSP